MRDDVLLGLHTRDSPVPHGTCLPASAHASILEVAASSPLERDLLFLVQAAGRQLLRHIGVHASLALDLGDALGMLHVRARRRFLLRRGLLDRVPERVRVLVILPWGKRGGGEMHPTMAPQAWHRARLTSEAVPLM